MAVREIFGARVKLLRSAYRVSTFRLASLLGLKANGNISMIEKAQCGTSVFTENNFANLFAVELGFLFGHSSVLYTENTMPYFEEFIDGFELSRGYKFSDFAPEYYLDKEVRKKVFSLEDRANMVFLLHYYLYLVTRFSELKEDVLTVGFQIGIYNPELIEMAVFDRKSFRFKDYHKEFQYVCSAIGYILFHPLRKEKAEGQDVTIEPLYSISSQKDIEWNTMYSERNTEGFKWNLGKN